MQALHRFIVAYASGECLPALDAPVRGALRSRGVAQDQPSARAQGAAVLTDVLLRVLVGAGAPAPLVA